MASLAPSRAMQQQQLLPSAARAPLLCGRPARSHLARAALPASSPAPTASTSHRAAPLAALQQRRRSGGACAPEAAEEAPPPVVAPRHSPLLLAAAAVAAAAAAAGAGPALAEALPAALAGAAAAAAPLAEVADGAAGGGVSELAPAAAHAAEQLLRPLFTLFTFLYIIRIPMSWYPELDGKALPWALSWVPTEPVLAATRKVIPLIGGVDMTPIFWVGMLSFLSEILLGPQGLLILLQRPGALP